VEVSGLGVKTALIESMIRVAPNQKAQESMVAALSYLPLEALQRISEFGTKLEVYDKTQSDLPLYAKHLEKPNLAGAYSPTANVIFVDENNITARILVHESMHALDASLGNPSSQKPWTVARDLARSTRQAIRPYATHNSAEYFADNLAASLFGKEEMTKLLVHDYHHGIGTEGLDKRELVSSHIHYHREGQAQADSLGSKLCSRFWEVLPQYPRAEPKAALTPQEYRTELVERLRRKKRSEAA
jgi:hypothetical protein